MAAICKPAIAQVSTPLRATSSWKKSFGTHLPFTALRTSSSPAGLRNLEKCAGREHWSTADSKSLLRRKCIGSSGRSSSVAVNAMAPIQLYSMATPNGQKIPIALEEMGVAYEAHMVDISKGDQFAPEFVKINPNSKIPAIVDPEGPDGKPLSVFESGAILMYLAEKYGQLLPKDPVKKWEAIQWVFFQVGGVGPMMGQLGHFAFLPKEKMDHPYPKERYLTEVKRLFKVVDAHLEGREYMAGEYSIADISLGPWMNGARTRMTSVLDMSEYPNVAAWLDRFCARPAVQKGMTVNAKA